MMALSSRWPALLCMATLFLSWLTPLALAKGIKTSEVFKVLTDEDNVGGSCKSRMDQVEALIPEVQELVDAATDALKEILSDPLTLPVWSKSKKLNRMRLLLLARQFLGTEWDEKSLKVKDKDVETGLDFKKTLTDFRDEFKEIKKEIEKKDKNYRFACDDSWVEKIKELKTDIGSTKKGTPVSEVDGLKGGGNDDWAWFDRGGPKVRPAESADDTTTQRSWYFSSKKGWPSDGPCAPVVVDGKPSAPYAETIYAPQKIIFFCQRIWDRVDGVLKKDIRELKKSKIATDGSEYLDSYMSPGAILLHEMTHQVFQSEDHPPNALGYDFVNVIKGRKYPDRAIANADSYPYFAVAAYLSQVEWHSGKARDIGKQEGTGDTPSR